MTAELAVVSSAAPEPSDIAVRKLAEFMGAPVVAMDLAGFDPGRPLTAMSARTLARRLASGATREEKLSSLPPGRLFAWGFSGDEEAGLLALLTDGELGGVALVPTGARTYGFTEVLTRHDLSLAGLSRQWTEARELCAFAPARSNDSIAILVAVEGRPLLVRVQAGATELVLLADACIPSVEEVCASDAALSAAQAALLPAAVALRIILGAACWTNPFPAANLVIDDPMIWPRYGFVDYPRLMTEAKTHGYAVTVAFIPFNRRRSDRRTAAFLRGNRERFSIAVHGCDHTAGEFGAPDPVRLRHLSQLAVDRMREHETRSGMGFDRVMVFPQGHFSAAAFPALKRSGYDAVVNTELFPKSGTTPGIPLRELLGGATMTYDGMPLFSRRYPTCVFDFATDLFWGKPVLLVEHHGYFKAGYPHLAAFVRELGRLSPRLVWKPLGAVVTEHALFRPTGPGRMAVRFFTPTFRLRNPTAGRTVFALEKTETEPDLLEQVMVNGSPVVHEVVAGVLRLGIELPVAGEAAIQIVYRKAPAPDYRLAASYRFKAAARRYLSEFRDNHVARNSRLLWLATKLKQCMARR